MNLMNEIKRRMNDDNDIYQALGAEIKQHRINQSKTLSTMADKSFSISYLCKIENNQVKPSQKYLKEICNKVNISDDKVSTLLSSRDILLDVVRCFYCNDIKTQNDILYKFIGLENHRIILIRFICAITRLDLVECNSYITKLWNLASSLANIDLVIFTTFYGIYKYYIGNYIEASDYIKTALEFNVKICYLDAIQYGFLFMSAYNTYSRNTDVYYLKLLELSNKYGTSLDLEQVHYYMALYYLMFRQYNNFNNILLKLGNDINKYSLNIMSDIMLGKEITVDEEKLNVMAKLYYYVTLESNKCIEMIKKANINNTIKLLLQYLYYKKTDLLKSIDYICDVLIPYIVDHNIGSIGYKLLYEILSTPIKVSKYKRLCDMFEELYMINLAVDGL